MVMVIVCECFTRPGIHLHGEHIWSRSMISLIRSTTSPHSRIMLHIAVGPKDIDRRCGLCLETRPMVKYLQGA